MSFEGIMQKRTGREKRKQAMLKGLKIIRAGSGYYTIRHMTWLWSNTSHTALMRESSNLVKKLIFLGYYFSTDELAITFRAVRKGNAQYFDFFESGQYIPTQRDIDWAEGMLSFQLEKYQERADMIFHKPVGKGNITRWQRSFKRGQEIISKEWKAKEGVTGWIYQEK